MFTGIIESIGSIRAMTPKGGDVRLLVETGKLDLGDVKLGDSIAVSGGAIIHAMGPIGAVVAGFGATQVLSDGSDWQTAALWFGALPCFLSGALMFAAHGKSASFEMVGETELSRCL